MEQETTQKPVTKPVSTGNINAALTYVFGWITGVIFLLIEKDDKFIRMHAAQSLVVFGSFNILLMIPVVGQVLGFLVSPFIFILWVFLMYQAYNNKEIRLPIVSTYIERVEQLFSRKV